VRLVIHHLKKDLRYLRLLLLPWFVLLLVNSLLIRSGLDLSIASEEGIEVLSSAYVLLYVLQQILQIVIVCQLVQADALAGTTAFWLTRPISRKQLLLSKSLFVLLVLLLPSVIAEVIVLQVNGISVSQTLYALPQEIILQSALFLMPTMLLASLTPSLARLAIVGLGSVTAFFLIHYAVLASVMTFGTASRRRMSAVFPGQWPTIFSGNPSGMMVSAILAIGLCGMVIASQYLKRRTVHSATAAVLGMCLVIAALNLWSWDLLRSRQWWSARTGLNPESIQLVVSKEPGAGFVRDDRGQLMILGRVEPQGVPPDYFLEVIRQKAAVEFSDRKRVTSSLDYPWGLFGNSGFAGGLQLEKDLKVLNDPAPMTRPMAIPLLSLDVETFQSYQGAPATYSAEAMLRVYERLTTILPLTPGSSDKDDLGRTSLVRIVPNQDTLLAGLSKSKRDGFVISLRESGVRQWVQRTSVSGALYVLRNQARKEALFGRPLPQDIFGRFPTLHRLVISRSSIYFTTAGIPDYQGPVIDEQWLQQAELVRVTSRVIGQFSKSVRAENFVMKTP